MCGVLGCASSAGQLRAVEVDQREQGRQQGRARQLLGARPGLERGAQLGAALASTPRIPGLGDRIPALDEGRQPRVIEGLERQAREHLGVEGRADQGHGQARSRQ